MADQSTGTALDGVKLYYGFGEMVCKATVRSMGLQQLLNYPKEFKFDLVLYDYTIGPCLLGFLHRFGYPPLIALTAYPNPPGTVDVSGGHNHFAYIPFSTFAQDGEMNFFRRLQNLYIYAYDY